MKQEHKSSAHTQSKSSHTITVERPKEDQVTIIYYTDVWHTHASRILIGIATAPKKIIEIINKNQAKNGCKPISQYDKDMLQAISQTSADSEETDRNGEYVIEREDIDTFLL